MKKLEYRRKCEEKLKLSLEILSKFFHIWTVRINHKGIIQTSKLWDSFYLGREGATLKLKWTEWQNFSQAFPNQRGGLKISPKMIPFFATFLVPLRVASLSPNSAYLWSCQPSVLAFESHGAEWTWTGVQSDLEATGSSGGVGGRDSHQPHPAGDDTCCLCAIRCPGPSHQSPGLWPWATVSDSLFWRRL